MAVTPNSVRSAGSKPRERQCQDNGGPRVSTAIRETPTTSARRSEPTGSMQLVSFRLAQEEYGIEITRVQEIILMGEITRVPQTPP